MYVNWEQYKNFSAFFDSPTVSLLHAEKKL